MKVLLRLPYLMSLGMKGLLVLSQGNLKEDYQCPCVVFAKSGKLLKGSIRSISDVHIKDLLDLIDRENPTLIGKFGGHAMAAGLTINPENFEEFKEAFTGAITDHLEGKKPIIELLTDGKLDASEMTLKECTASLQVSPMGSGF